MTAHRSTVSVLLALTAGLAACGDDATPHPENGIAPPPDAMEVTVRELSTAFPVHGSVEARKRAEISTRVMARVTAVHVDVGSRVGQGEILIRLGLDDVEARRATAEAAVAAARAARDEAARQAARMDTLYAQDAVARVQRDQAHLALTQAESQLAAAAAALREVETAEGYARIAAPFAGAVVARHVDPGDLAAPGRPLLVLESAGPREAVLAVPADLASHLAVGGRIAVAAPDGRRADARIRAVAPGADPATRTVEVRAALPADWPTGIAVTGFVPAGAHRGVAVPARAVVRRGQLTGVRVASESGVTIRWVRLGRVVEIPGGAARAEEGDPTGDAWVEVLSGLEPGERILP